MKKILRLGQEVVDNVTNETGTLISLHVDEAQQRHYLFQPRGLNKKTGQPLESVFATASRFPKADKVKMPDYVPLEVLGTKVEDLASGYKGVATSLVLHLNGCVHFNVQSPTTKPESGEMVKSVNLDVRRLKGEKVPILSEEQQAASHRDNPSPASDEQFAPDFG